MDPSPLDIGQFMIYECESCRHRFQMEPSVEKLNDFYINDAECYSFHTTPSYRKGRSFFSRLILSMISEHVNNGSLIELGCGLGIFLDVAK